MAGKRKAGEQGGRYVTAPEFARRLIESMHKMEVWGKLKELEFYIHLSPSTDLNRDERDAIADCLECKFAKGDFDTLQRDFQTKLTALERVTRGRYEHVIAFLRPLGSPSKTEMTNYALRTLDSSNVDCLKDLLVKERNIRINSVADSIIDALKKPGSLTFEASRDVTLDIQEFVTYLFPWQRQILHLHLLTSEDKPHPAEVAWTQDALMSPGIAQVVHEMMTERRDVKSPEMQQLSMTIETIIAQTTFPQPGFMAAKLRSEAGDLCKQEMDGLIGKIRDAQDFIRR
ncbi:hypothetical protein JX266_014120 [Neoarthrinium moseri]|nr:hypothetical protein JX266_014120 [Neoarthrinium moseri]